MQRYAKNEHVKNKIVPYLAKVSLQMNHLYKDLGFDNRMQMGRYMKKYFPVLTQKKPADKLWKKFIYDSIIEVAPACAICSDQKNCWTCKI